MCNIAGYVGNKSAASTLIRMIKIQEGLNGGFYTGLAVHDGKKLNYRKTLGELNTLLNTSDADKLQGNVGIMHSRTPDGGDGSWAHPFFSVRDGDTKLCYVANGGFGYFAERRAEYNEITNCLVKDGFDIPCKLNYEGENYNRLSSGEAVHMSDVMCQMIYKYKTLGKNTAEAMSCAFAKIPVEIVGLAIDKESPDRIYFARINQPMFVGFDSDGAYLASSPLAFPETVNGFTLLPPRSSGVVYKDGYEVVSQINIPEKVESFAHSDIEAIEKMILSLLEERKYGANEFMDILEEKVGGKKIAQTDAKVYLAIDSLLKKGAVKMENARKEAGELSAPWTLFSLAE